jgi:hypothetical protein
MQCSTSMMYSVIVRLATYFSINITNTILMKQQKKPTTTATQRADCNMTREGGGVNAQRSAEQNETRRTCDSADMEKRPSARYPIDGMTGRRKTMREGAEEDGMWRRACRQWRQTLEKKKNRDRQEEDGMWRRACRQWRQTLEKKKKRDRKEWAATSDSAGTLRRVERHVWRLSG